MLYRTGTSVLFSTTLLFYAPNATSCFAPPKVSIVPVEELVARTSSIYLAQAVSAKNSTVVFSVSEYLKGAKTAQITVDGSFTDSNDSDFDSHHATAFWKSSGGRLRILPDCSLRPTFRKGKTYLVFVDRPYHLKSFELISNREDEWLIKVRTILKRQH